MKSHKFRMRARGLLAALVSAALPVSSLASAGRVNFAIGQVTSIDKDGKQRRLVRGSRINSGDTIKTSRGRAQLRFSDGGYTSLAPNTEFRIDDYQDAEEPSRARSFFSLLKGGLRTITGAIGKLRKKAYRLTTPVATIGIRGTEFVAVYDGEGLTISIGDGIVRIEAGGVIRDYPAGETVNIPFAGSKPQTTEEQPTIPPTSPDVDYSVSDDRTANGGSASLPTGPVVGTNGPLYGLATAYAFDLVDNGYGGFNFNVALESRGSLEENEPVTGLFDSQGQLLSFSFDGPVSDPPIVGAINSNGSFADTGSADGQVGWGRWTSGLVTASPEVTAGPLHYVVGLPTAEVPTTGSADYLFAGGTSPTLVSMSEGLVVGSLNPASHLHANFALPNNQVDAHLFTEFDVNGNNEKFTSVIPMTLGSGADRFAFSGIGSTSGGACSNGCQAFGKGGFAGPGASHAGLAYKHETGYYGEYVLGAAAFRNAPAGTAPQQPPAGF